MHSSDSDTTTDESTGRTIAADTCPDCAGRVRTDGGETRCQECGLIIECGRLDRRGKRVFDEDDTGKKRTGAPLTTGRHDRGLTTTIGHGTDASGTTLSTRKQRQLRRLRREHKRAKFRSKAERNLAHGLGEIARCCGELDLPHSVREQASALFRSAQEHDLLRGRSIEAIAAGSLYGACRVGDVTRSLEEIVAVARVGYDRVRNGYRTLNTELGLPTPPQRPMEFLPELASELDFPGETEHAARTLARRAHDGGLSVGKHPAGFAAACLQVAAEDHGLSVTQLAIADVAGVSAHTVRAHAETLRAEFEDDGA